MSNETKPSPNYLAESCPAFIASAIAAGLAAFLWRTGEGAFALPPAFAALALFAWGIDCLVRWFVEQADRR